MAQETAGLIAWLRHDMADPAASEAAYRLADRLLDASGDRLLAGYVTAFRAITRSARGDPEAGARDLQTAADQLGRAAPSMLAAWLSALRAEHEARQQRHAATLTLLRQADQELERADDNPGARWMYMFDEGRLAGYRGSCFLELGKLADAEVAFDQAMCALPTRVFDAVVI